uniref:Cadherin domain-containing protein n=1 Tax=Oncorhynchus tshawytscha TaxID=74940 RepID=A0AAZ3QDD8_ONCTS
KSLSGAVGAVDPDVGVNGIQNYYLKPTDHFQLEVHSLSNGGKYIEMILQHPLDREKQETLSLVLIATDGGEPQRSGTVRIHITVLDANDNAPVCGQPVYKADVKESSPKGTLITTVSANDADKGINGEVTFAMAHVSKEAKELFELNVSTGEIKLVAKVDFEKTNNYQLNVQAKDHWGLADTCKVITVLDVNDNAPVFNQSVYRAAVVENGQKGTYITTVNASDADRDTNGQITYSFSKLKGSIADIFVIDQNSGIISVSGQIDFEKDKKYEVRVEAKDQGGLTDSSKVVIEVIDVNDNSPVINVMSFSSPVSEDAPPGTTIAIINVKDADSERNGQITCSIDTNLPFKIKSSLTNYYNLITDSIFDREAVSPDPVVRTY